MFKQTHRLIFALVYLLAATALAGCSSGAEVTLPPVSGAVNDSTPGMSVLITESDCPYIDSIKVNDTVTWTNADKVAHQIHIEYEDGETMGDIGPLQPGDTASWTFPEAGVYPYSCAEGEEPSASITVVP